MSREVVQWRMRFSNSSYCVIDASELVFKNFLTKDIILPQKNNKNVDAYIERVMCATI